MITLHMEALWHLYAFCSLVLEKVSASASLWQVVAALLGAESHSAFSE